MIRALLGLPLAVTCWAQSTPSHYPEQTESDFVVRNFAFKSGETLPELRLHYITIGKPVPDASGHVSNAVLIMHGTGGNGNGFLSERFGDELFRAGQPFDSAKYFIILPDAIGHGKSSKPSDGLHARFPHYRYDEMVRADYLLVHDGLKIDHLRPVMGTSMDAMQTWIWGKCTPTTWTH
jgi:homoserine O-acetyltransferase